MIATVPITLDEERVKLCERLSQAGLDNFRKYAGFKVTIDTDTARPSDCGEGVTEWDLSCEMAKQIGMNCYEFPHTHRICAHFVDVD